MYRFLVSVLQYAHVCNMFEPIGRSLHQLTFGVIFTKALNIIMKIHNTDGIVGVIISHD